ncbi:MAG TPA: 16S rRNA (uracil(1498)-N(3))-methyltransferase [Desulfobulbaceae bacterium]|nr:16S rRNA (uracil(1498)-N(3))-methyltransferase [Desulfobulbaceae bacterium]
MNILLFEPGELRRSLLSLPEQDRRVQHIVNVLGLAPGDDLRAGMLNGKMGTARILGLRNGTLEMEVSLTASPPKPSGIELILALPRPIMLQRILKQATVLGVSRFHLIRSQKVQKSYFQGSVLQAQNLRELLRQGLEQAVDTRLPEVCLHHRFRPFVEDVVPTLKAASRLLAHPGAGPTLAELHGGRPIGEPLLLALGPEGGWSEHEVGAFRDQGFTSFSLGPRILHVDTAALVLLAQVRFLQELSEDRGQRTEDR